MKSEETAASDEFIYTVAKKEGINVKKVLWANFVYGGMGAIWVEGAIEDRKKRTFKVTVDLKIAQTDSKEI